MRDIIVLGVFVILLLYSFKRHYMAPLVWAWMGLMNPHRLTYGFAYDLPFAQVAAISLILIFFISKDKKPFPTSTPAMLMVSFYLWMGLTSLTTFNNLTGDVYEMWVKVSKIQIMLFLSLMMLGGRKQIDALVWVIVISIGFFGVKGGIFTIGHGGTSMVQGPEGSFIDNTTHIALAMTMVVPLMYYQLSTNVTSKWGRRAMYATMILTVLSVFGTTSRGSLLATIAMSTMLGLKSKHKFKVLSGVVLVLGAMSLFMSDQWGAKMGTISSHEDESAQSRLYTWKMCWNLALHNPITGGGFDITNNPITWQTYAVTAWGKAYSPHSIYFQAMAEHGFVGLFLYLGIGISAWRLCSSIIRRSKSSKDLEWADLLARMCQASLLGFAVGGAFVNLVNFDLPYYVVGIVVLVDRAVKDAEQDKEKARKAAAAAEAAKQAELMNAQASLT